MADPTTHLSRRERQIMDALYAHEELSPAQVAEQLPDPPTSTAVRTMLHTLMDKGLLHRRKVGREYLYRPKTGHTRAGQSAMDRVVNTFFGGSLDQALAAYLSGRQDQLSDADLNRMAKVIREAKRKGE